MPGWHPTPGQLLVWAIRGALVLGVFALVASAVDKTLWDWLDLLIVPAVLALVGYVFTSSQNRAAPAEAERRAQDDAVQEYLDRMRQLMIDNALRNERDTTYLRRKKAEKPWQMHLCVNDASLFPAKFNTWETKVIEEEISRDDVIGWLRNPERKDWSLCVPYKLGGVQRPLYPDFLFVRSTENGLVVDLLDPHLLSLEDAPAKAVGLAEYAEKHQLEFGRIELIIVQDDEIKSLDLTDEQTRTEVKQVQSIAHLRHLYNSA